MADGGVPDDVHAPAAACSDGAEPARVPALVRTIDPWNRVALATAGVAGSDER
ncbi:hypothetical protein [Streptomyces sp. NPDC003401]